MGGKGTKQVRGEGTTEYAIRLYGEGNVTLNEAADLASVTPREMLEILRNRGIKGNITLDQQRKAIEHATKRLKRDSTPR